MHVVGDNAGMLDQFSYRTPSGWQHNCFSNGFIEPDGTFVEREYRAARAKYPDDAARILVCTEPFGPNGSKQLGRSVDYRDDWEQVRYQVMVRLVMKKFRDHPSLAEQLLATGDALIIEGNTWHDNTWGDCHCQDSGHPKCAQPGLNLLGQILMSVREALRQFAR